MPVLVVGGSKGIGLSIARALSRKDDDIFLAYAHDDQAANNALTEIEVTGARAHLVKGDIGSQDGVTHILGEVARKVRHIDKLVHSAVYPLSKPILELSAADYCATMQINGSSLFFLVREALPLLRSGSSIVFVSSPGAKFVIPGYAAIGVPKALAEALVRYLAVELGPRDVRINIVSPSALPTDAVRMLVSDLPKLLERQRLQTPLLRNPSFDDVASAVSFLMSPAASMITGQEIVIDGGLSLKYR